MGIIMLMKRVKSRLMFAGLAAAIPAALLCPGLAPRCLAQMPPDVYTIKQAPTTEQALAIDKFVNDQTDRIKSDEGRAMSDGIRSLLSPYRRDTTLSFRLAFADAITRHLAPVADDEKSAVDVRIAAIRILGSAASPDSVSALHAGLDSTMPAIRYAAGNALGRALSEMRSGRGAFANTSSGEQQVGTMLQSAIARETDPQVLYAVTEAAANSGTATVAIQTLSNGLTAQCKRLYKTPALRLIPSLQNGIDKLQARYIDIFSSGGNNVTSQKLIVTTACQAILVGIEAGTSKTIQTDADKEACRKLVEASENVLNLLCNMQPVQNKVTVAVADGRYADALKLMEATWLADGGPVYGNSAWDFKKGEIEDSLKN